MIGKDVFANNSRKITDEIYNVKEQLELLAQSQNRINNNENSSYVKSLQSQTDMYKKMMSDYNCELDNIQNDRRLFFMICVNTENGIKYRMVIGLVSRKAAYCP